MKRLLALTLLIHLFTAGVGGLLGYGWYIVLYRNRPHSSLSAPLTEADRLPRSQEGVAQPHSSKGGT